MEIGRRLLDGAENIFRTVTHKAENLVSHISQKVSRAAEKSLGEVSSDLAETINSDDLHPVHVLDSTHLTDMRHAVRQSLDTPSRLPQIKRSRLPEGVTFAEIMQNPSDEIGPGSIAMDAADAYRQAQVQAQENLNAIQADGSTFLIQAIQAGDLNKASILLAQGAQPMLADNKNILPLEHALQKQDLAMVKLLLKHGAETRVWDSDGFPLLLCSLIHTPHSQKPNVELLACLLAAGADINQATVPGGNTAMHWAAMSGAHEVIEFLLQHHAHINQPNDEGDTPLHLAAVRGQDQTISFLIARGADKEAKNQQASRPLHLAASHGSLETIQALIDAGASTKVLTASGLTPAMVAFQYNHVPAGNMLTSMSGAFEDLWLQQKTLAHRFGITGTIACEGQAAKLEGLNYPLIYPTLCESIRQHFQRAALRHKNEMKLPETWLLQDFASAYRAFSVGFEQAFNFQQPHLRQTALKNILEKIQAGEPIALPISWRGHATGIVVVDDLLITCNRGSGAGDKPGIIVYQMKNPGQLATCLEHLLDEENLDTNKAFFLEGMHQQLGLVELEYLPHKDQGAGNCVWASSKTIFRAVLYAQLRKKKLSPIDASTYSRDMYKFWTARDRLASVRKFCEQTPIENRGWIQRSFMLRRVYEKSFRFPAIQKMLTPEMQGVHKRDLSGNTPLHLALTRGEYSQLQTLIEQGGEVRAINNMGDTPLHLACRCGQNEVIVQLLQASAPVLQANFRGKIPLQVACLYGNLDAAIELTREDVNTLHHFDLNHANCLMDAIQSRNVQLVRFLLEQGVSYNFVTKDGLSPYDMAKLSLAPEISSLLASYHALPAKDLIA